MEMVKKLKFLPFLNWWQKSSGVILLIITAIMAVALTIGILTISRSVTDIRISQKEEESARAFSVAEAGIEQALQTGLEGPVEVGGITANVSRRTLGESTTFVFPDKVEQGEAKTLWLVEHEPTSGLPDPTVAGAYEGKALSLYWGNEFGQPADQDETPALEAAVFYETGGHFEVARYAFDPNSARTSTNHFEITEVGKTIEGHDFPFKATLDPLPAGTLYAVKIKLIYNNEVQSLAVEDVGGDDSFPSQGECWDSVATVFEAGNQITRRIEHCQPYQSPPGIFDYVLFSEGDLTTNN